MICLNNEDIATEKMTDTVRCAEAGLDKEKREEDDNVCARDDYNAFMQPIAK